MENLSAYLPGWQIVRTIGRGSFGNVYEIEKDDGIGGVIRSALKVISIPENHSDITAYRDDGYDDESLTTLFKSQVEDITSEFRLMNKLKGCSNIVSFEDYSIVQHDSDPGFDIFIRMELLTPLPKTIEWDRMNNHQINDTVKRLGIDICKALELCSHFNIIHRDIKPQNIFVNELGDYKLGDFGIAKTSDHTTKATKTGTYGYMAPEVFWGKPYNAAVDLYSLGIVMYWMLNERRGPFLPLPPAVPKPSDNAAALDRRMSGEQLPAPKNGSEELKRIVLKACAFDPKERYADAASFRRDLERVSDKGQQKEETEISWDERTIGANRIKPEEQTAQNIDETESTVGLFRAKKQEETVKPNEIPIKTPIRMEAEEDEKTVGVFTEKHQREQTPIEIDEDKTVSVARPTQTKQPLKSNTSTTGKEKERTTSVPYTEVPKQEKQSERKIETVARPNEKEQKHNNSKPKQRNTLWIILAAAVAFVAIVVVSIVLLNSKSSKSIPATASTTATPTPTALTTGKWLSTKSISRAADGSITSWSEPEYDVNGNLVKITSFDAEGNVISLFEYEYDASGNQTKMTSLDGDGIIWQWDEYEYDADDNQIKSTSFSRDGSIMQRLEYEYDANGNQIKVEFFNSEGIASWWYTGEYDIKNNRIKTTYYDADGIISSWSKSEYDASNNRIKTTGYDADGIISSWSESEYDSNGNQIKNTSFNSDGSIISWVELEYDSNGNRIKHSVFNADGSLNSWTEYEWQYYDGSQKSALKPSPTAIPTDNAKVTMKIAFIADLMNASYTARAWEGVSEFCETNGMQHGEDYNYYSPSEYTTEAHVEAIKLAIDDAANVVVCPGYMFEEAVYLLQDEYPEVIFLILDGEPHSADYSDYRIAANTKSVLFMEEQAGWLAGYAAVREGYKRLGFLGAMPVPAIERYKIGFIQGALYAGGAATWTYANQYMGDASITTEMNHWYKERGVEVIFACGGTLYTSVVEAAKNCGGKVIGYDTDLSSGSDCFLTSAIKDYGNAVIYALEELAANNGKWRENSVRLGAADNCVGLPTVTWRFQHFTIDDYNEIYSRLKDGSIEVSTDNY